MSEFRTVQCDFNDEESLVAALTDMGYKPVVHQDAQSLYGFQGDKRSQKANIIIPRNQVGSASNDIGFLRQKDGKYMCHVSEYDKHRWNKRNGELKQKYAQNRIVKFARRRGYSVRNTKTVEDGSIKITIGL